MSKYKDLEERVVELERLLNKYDIRTTWRDLGEIENLFVALATHLNITFQKESLSLGDKGLVHTYKIKEIKEI